MASGLHRRLKNTATYWAPTGYDAFGGRTFAAPVVFSHANSPQNGVYWNDRTDVHMTTKPGDTQRVRANVYLTTSVVAEGYFFLGTSAATDPTTVSAAGKILRVESDPDIRNLLTLYKATLE